MQDSNLVMQGLLEHLLILFRAEFPRSGAWFPERELERPELGGRGGPPPVLKEGSAESSFSSSFLLGMWRPFLRDSGKRVGFCRLH